LYTKEKSAVIYLEAKALLEKELQEARDRIEWLEAANKEISSQMCIYGVKWINEARRADALEMYGPLDAPSLSQADWMSSSPDRSYGR